MTKHSSICQCRVCESRAAIDRIYCQAWDNAQLEIKRCYLDLKEKGASETPCLACQARESHDADERRATTRSLLWVVLIALVVGVIILSLMIHPGG